MTCLAFYYVPDTVFPEAGMRTGMCCCSASAQREKNLSCYHALAKRRERMRKERESRVTQGSWGVGEKVAQAKITFRKKQPITIKRTLGSSEIYSVLSGRFAAFHWPILAPSFSRLWFSLQLLWCSGLRPGQRLHNCLPVIGAASLNPSPASLPLFLFFFFFSQCTVLMYLCFIRPVWTSATLTHCGKRPAVPERGEMR